ncbi:unnamed protein product [Allacma fusca]|uniref:Protein-S-isoprenylcysteine O-methyltransferase n=1 Tax=Allacma fusca TaxID=39272 RepID=A0A8J2LJW6_9HEXA|nr:unnamed protein product [Allacma fusca]
MKMHVILRSYLLGFGFSIGQLLVWKTVDRAFGSYLSILCCFHYSEFLVTSIINPSALSLDSFLLNHSVEYGIAAGASWLEYAIELCLFPGLKLCQWPMKIGLFFCIAGELLRKGAMLTAWSNFTHLVRETRVEGHKLVTHGIFSLCRHPSYAGWFWWSIGTQVCPKEFIKSISIVET